MVNQLLMALEEKDTELQRKEDRIRELQWLELEAQERRTEQILDEFEGPGPHST